MVIGPTPPGTGVIAPATASASSNAICARHPVDADVDYGRAGLDEVAPHHAGRADGGDQDVGVAADAPEVLGAGMGDGDGAIGGQQQGGHRLADDAGAADHHGVQARGRLHGLADQLHAALGRAGD
jgi:hypothetical protein